MRTSWLFPVTRRGWLWFAFRMVFLIVLPICLLLRYMLHIPGQSYEGPLAPITSTEQALAGKMSAHVHAIASKEHNTRYVAALDEAAQYIESQLAGIGYPVSRQAYQSDGVQVRNLEVEITGRTKPQEIVIVGAHYDSARGAPGANDNGSGTAMVLELARSLKASHPERTLRFVLFTNEEPPYFGTKDMGGRRYADRARERGENIVAMLSLETVGYYDDADNSQQYPNIFKPFFPTTGNFIGFVGDLKSREMVHRSVATFRSTVKFPSEGIATFSWIKGVDWSDHAAFWENGYRALMVTDTAVFRYPHYHTRQDTPDNVDYQRMARVFRGVRAVIVDLAGAKQGGDQ